MWVQGSARYSPVCVAKRHWAEVQNRLKRSNHAGSSNDFVYLILVVKLGEESIILALDVQVFWKQDDEGEKNTRTYKIKK